jgi:hypothetical protein
MEIVRLEGKSEEEKNGYVVIKENIRGSAAKNEALLRPPSTPFYKLAFGQIFKDDVNGFSYTSNICFTGIEPAPLSGRIGKLIAHVFYIIARLIASCCADCLQMYYIHTVYYFI